MPKMTAIVKVPGNWTEMSNTARQNYIASELRALAYNVEDGNVALVSMRNRNGNTTRVKVSG